MNLSTQITLLRRVSVMALALQGLGAGLWLLSLAGLAAPRSWLALVGWAALLCGLGLGAASLMVAASLHSRDLGATRTIDDLYNATPPYDPADERKPVERVPPRPLTRLQEVRFRRTVAHEGRGHIAFAQIRNSADGFGGNFLDVSIVPPGGEIGVHTHSIDNEEIYVIVQGRATMLIEGESVPVTSGDVVINPPGGTHGLINDSDAGVLLVVVEVAVRDAQSTRTNSGALPRSRNHT